MASINNGTVFPNQKSDPHGRKIDVEIEESIIGSVVRILGNKKWSEFLPTIDGQSPK